MLALLFRLCLLFVPFMALPFCPFSHLAVQLTLELVEFCLEASHSSRSIVSVCVADAFFHFVQLVAAVANGLCSLRILQSVQRLLLVAAGGGDSCNHCRAAAAPQAILQ